MHIPRERRWERRRLARAQGGRVKMGRGEGGEAWQHTAVTEWPPLDSKVMSLLFLSELRPNDWPKFIR